MGDYSLHFQLVLDHTARQPFAQAPPGLTIPGSHLSRIEIQKAEISLEIPAFLTPIGN